MAGSKGAKLAKGFDVPQSPPPRTPVAADRAERFEGASDTPAAHAAAVPKGPRSTKLRRAERGERVAVYLPKDLAERLRVRCAKERRSTSDAVTVAVERWMSKWNEGT